MPGSVRQSQSRVSAAHKHLCRLALSFSSDDVTVCFLVFLVFEVKSLLSAEQMFELQIKTER